MPLTGTPTSARLSAYQVGFGDCFLLTLRYGDQPGDPRRHVLVDFGSTALAKGTAGKATPSLEEVAKDIAAEVGTGRLDVVVATHRHKDHIAGFAGPSGKIIAALKPRLVIQPWTDDPEAAVDARRPAGPSTMNRLGVQALADVALATHNMLAEAGRLRAMAGASSTAAREIAFIGDDNLPNKPAQRALASMGSRHVYAHEGKPLSVKSELPGVIATVLGPPTIAQTDTILKQRSKDAAEFWHILASAAPSHARRDGGIKLRGKSVPLSRAPFGARWLVGRLRRARQSQILGVVRAMDDAVNNSSLILLLEVGKAVLLFPGDAQIENWLWALQGSPRAAAHRKALSRVTHYKVGHHGSLNATPKTLWGLFDRRGGVSKPGRLASVLSTMAGEHGSESRNTEVPRRKLVDALRADTHFSTTEQLQPIRAAGSVAPIRHDIEIRTQ